VADHAGSQRIRPEVAAALVAALGDTWFVLPAPNDVAKLDGSYTAGLLVHRTNIAPGPTVGEQTHTLAVLVFVPQTTPDGSAEDALDGAADALIEALTPLDWLIWTGAERINYQDTYPAYRFTVTVQTTITEE
jgi:hypothetical protein